MGNERNLSDDESMLDSIDESSIDYEYDDRSISTNTLEDIRYVKYLYPEINAIDARLEICEYIR